MKKDLINKLKNRIQNKRLKVGITSFSSCSGCLVEVLSLAKQLNHLIELIDIRHFPLIDEHYNIDQPFDLVFVEGSISNEKQKLELIKLRENTKLLVALGDCACFGNLQARVNNNVEEHKALVYANDSDKIDCFGHFPLSKFVKVDRYLLGCPIFRDEFKSLVYDVIIGKREEHNNRPVCWECKLKGNKCLLLQGILCLGPITKAGCNALCPNNNQRCIGCRGTNHDQYSLKPFIRLLKTLGYGDDEIKNSLIKYAPSDLWNEKTISLCIDEINNELNKKDKKE